MHLGTLGVFCFTDALTPAQLIELAQRTEQLGYAALWYPEVLGYESFALGSFLLTQTTRLIIASGIANIYARDATAAKQGQHTLAKLSGGRFLLGLGVSHVPLVEEARGHQYRPPVAAMRAYLDAMDKAVAIAPALEEPPPTVLAALGPQMTALAAARTAGGLSLQCHPRAYGARAGHHRPGTMAVCRAKGAPGQGPHQGPSGGAAGDGVLPAPAQLPTQLAAPGLRRGGPGEWRQ